VVATLALFIALGGASYAALKLPKNSVGAKQLKKNSVTEAKLKNEAVTASKVKKGTLTGSQINLSTLGTVPSASHADSADKAGNAEMLGGSPSGAYARQQQEAVHLIGEPGEPEFEPGASNTAESTSSAGFYKDSLGVVHLQGTVNADVGQRIFSLPPGFHPTKQVCFVAPAFDVLVFAVDRVCVQPAGNIDIEEGEGSEFIGLDGFTFLPG
jgi:hypothetical protein